jgi:hypothetical protein
VAVAVAVLFVLGVLLLASWPLVQPLTTRRTADSAARLADLLTERDRVLAALKDVDLDLQMGKVSPEDHAATKAALERQALAALSRLDTERRRAATAAARDPA